MNRKELAMGRACGCGICDGADYSAAFRAVSVGTDPSVLQLYAARLNFLTAPHDPVSYPVATPELESELKEFGDRLQAQVAARKAARRAALAALPHDAEAPGYWRRTVGQVLAERA